MNLRVELRRPTYIVSIILRDIQYNFASEKIIYVEHWPTIETPQLQDQIILNTTIYLKIKSPLLPRTAVFHTLSSDIEYW